MYKKITILILSLVIFGSTVLADGDGTYSPYVATAYALKGRMANGQVVHSGSIAADPRRLPLGTRVEIKGMGTFTVKDTGGAIKNNRIDVWMPSNSQAMKFGRRTVQLRVLGRK